MDAQIQQADVAVIGGGIAGVAVAYAALRAGRRVTLFERDGVPAGATVRNFGLYFPMAAVGGPAHELALRSGALWQALGQAAGFEVLPSGSLFLARSPDEWTLLTEFAALHPSPHGDWQLLSADTTAAMAPGALRQGLLGALYSRRDCIIDSRQALPRLHAYLRHLGAEVHPGTAVTHIEAGRLLAGGQAWAFAQAFVCSGNDFETLFPDTFASSGLTKCKLQMMRTAPQPGGWRLGPALLGGLSMQHYRCFAGCGTLETLRARLAAQFPAHNAAGIHVMATQWPGGEVLIGDTHEYGLTPDPFIRQDLNTLIISYLNTFAQLPQPAIAETWYGLYPRFAQPNPPTHFHAQPQADVHIFGGLGGLGMTLALGLGQDLVAAVC